MDIVYRASHTGSKAVVWTKQIQSCISLFGLLFYSSLLLVFPHNPFTLLSAVQLWESSGCTTLKMKIYHTCTAVVIKHSCLPSSEMKSKYFNNTAMKWLQRGSKWWHCPNAAFFWLWQTFIYPLTQQEKLPLNPLKDAGWLMTQQEAALTLASCLRAGEDVRGIVHMCLIWWAVTEYESLHMTNAVW